MSWDGERVLFAWKKSDREDDYHLYEMEVADGSVRQLTHGLGFADYEGVYLPNGDILFNSTRCVQTVDCWWTEVSNLYTCTWRRPLSAPADLRPGARQLSDGDAGRPDRLYPLGIQRSRPALRPGPVSDEPGRHRPDASFTATTRGSRRRCCTPAAFPGTNKVVAIFSGHHTLQVGKLGIVDPARGRQENTGVS